jgi:hypothetical protein
MLLKKRSIPKKLRKRKNSPQRRRERRERKGKSTHKRELKLLCALCVSAVIFSLGFPELNSKRGGRFNADYFFGDGMFKGEFGAMETDPFLRRGSITAISHNWMSSGAKLGADLMIASRF